MNRWPLIGSAILIIGAIEHFVIVDLSLWILEAHYITWFPESLLNPMKSTDVNWGFLGETNFFSAFTGFSLWVVFSLLMIGLYNLTIFMELPAGHKLRFHSLILGLTTSVIFLAVAAVCFIYPAAVGGALAVLLFVTGIYKEKRLKT